MPGLVIVLQLGLLVVSPLALALLLVLAKARAHDDARACVGAVAGAVVSSVVTRGKGGEGGRLAGAEASAAASPEGCSQAIEVAFLMWDDGCIISTHLLQSAMLYVLATYDSRLVSMDLVCKAFGLEVSVGGWSSVVSSLFVSFFFSVLKVFSL